MIRLKILLFNISLNSKIESSIYETNNFLNKRQAKAIEENNNRNNDKYNTSFMTFIEYSAFFGSIQIFNYLKINGSELTESLCPLAIHCNNPEIIHILEEKINEFKIILNYFLNNLFVPL
mgnify:CR=1 FL=1